jgi:hypothetical protein
MKISDLMLCAKPLMFENQDERFRFSIQGTCVVVRFSGRLYAVTAKHCLNGRNRSSVRIRMVPGNLTWLPIQTIHTPEGKADFYDLAVVEFISSVTWEGYSPHCLNLEGPVITLKAPPAKALLGLVGYPASNNSIDYDTMEISTKGFSVDGRCLGPGEEAHCSIMRFNNVEPIEHLNGMSGSPVLQFEEIEEGVYRHWFAGILIRGSKQSNTGRFINAEVVIRALDVVHRRSR